MRTIAGVVALCLVVTVVGPPVAAGTADRGQKRLGDETFAIAGVDADSVILTARVEENGTTAWSVTYRVELTTRNETAAFDSLAADIAANRSAYRSAFRDRIGRTVRTAENATGRSMAVENLSVSTRTEGLQGTGVVTYRFRWTNFAATDGDRLRVGDALAGFFLEADSRLVVSWPEGYEATDVSPSPDDRRADQVAWNSPIEFGADGPSMVVAQPGPPLWLFALAALVAVGLIGGGFVAYRRYDGGDTTSAEDTDDEQTEDTGDEQTEDTDDEQTEASSPTGEEALLSNEERVLRLLDDEGGRVKQQTVAQRFDWTDAKTSQVVSTLRGDEKIEVFRLGRENVLVDSDESEL